MKYVVCIALVLFMSSCKRNDTEAPGYCWHCAYQSLFYDSYTRKAVYRTDSAEKCSYTEAGIREYEKTQSYTSVSTDTAGKPIDTGYVRVSCHLP